MPASPEGGTGGANAGPEEPDGPQPLKDYPTVLPRRIRLGVPIFSIAMLLLLVTLVASGKGTTDVFVPIFVFMLVVYVLSSLYFFKAFFEKDRSTVTATGQQVQEAKEDHR